MLAHCQLAAIGGRGLQGHTQIGVRQGQDRLARCDTHPRFHEHLADPDGPLPDDHVGGLERHVALNGLQDHADRGLPPFEESRPHQRDVALAGHGGSLHGEVHRGVLHRGLVSGDGECGRTALGHRRHVGRDGQYGDHRGGDVHRDAARRADGVRRVRHQRDRERPVRLDDVVGHRGDGELLRRLTGRHDDTAARSGIVGSLLGGAAVGHVDGQRRAVGLAEADGDLVGLALLQVRGRRAECHGGERTVAGDGDHGGALDPTL